MPTTKTLLKYWLPAVLWMSVIFTASSDAMSGQRTSRFIGPFLRWLYPRISDETVMSVQFFVRKGAHMTEYAILAGLLWRARRHASKDDARPWRLEEAVFALLISALYAGSDEFHQRFVTSREASLLDVTIDIAGAALGLLLIWRVGRWRKKW